MTDNTTDDICHLALGLLERMRRTTNCVEPEFAAAAMRLLEKDIEWICELTEIQWPKDLLRDLAYGLIAAAHELDFPGLELWAECLNINFDLGLPDCGIPEEA